ncbi:MAG: transposase [Lentisphaeria bacterium]|jgi:transposase
MIRWSENITTYLNREPVDLRKAINGLNLIVEEHVQLSVFDRAIFVFCSKNRAQIKVLYWNNTGFVLWQKRLEKAKLKWPRKHPAETITLTSEQWSWLLRGFDINRLKPHKHLKYRGVV